MDTVNSQTLEVRYLCTNCGVLHDTMEKATGCCAGEQVFLCGRKARGSGVRFHFDESEAQACAWAYSKGKRKVAGCIER